MQPGDFFFLCHGSDIQLLGQVSKETPKLRADPLERKYTVVCRLEGGPWRFKGHKKGWSPSGNTTCWPVERADHTQFESDILKPFFGMTLDDLRRWGDQSRGQPYVESAELLPPPPSSRAYKRPRGGPPSNRTGLSSRLYDPDKTGRRATMHDKCLDRLAEMFRRHRTCDLKEADYDLAVVEKNKALLVEAKTLRGDAARQLRLALGQLIFYQHLLVEQEFPLCKVFRLALTDRVPPNDLILLLERYQVGIISIPERKEVFASKLGRRFLKMFGIILKHRK
jgi:hypothetical protein